ncbi:MAG: M28 family peptidase [Cytophagaceae bacterium]|jgi:Zn-dependent M28 family amino/carboxypeptidase|nr:M28 family peptidase [Cytophagaceae bacterium]
MKFQYPILIACAVLFAGTSCGRQSSASTSAKAEKPLLSTPDFNADSAYRYTETQVAFGPRVPNTEAHAACANYLSGKLREFGADVIVQDAAVKAFDNSVLNIKNIIGQFQPEKNDRILLFAHWDSRPFADHDPDETLRNMPIDGANDGAGSVGALLEIARHLGESPTHLGIDIIFFDAEDYGIPDHRQVRYKSDTWCLGSQYWGKNPHRRNYYARYGILFDMIGAPNAQFYRELYSMEFAPDVVNKIWNTAAELGYGQWFNPERGGMITDDHVYVQGHLKIPCVDIIQHDPTTATNFGFYWHTHSDTMENIDRNTLKAVGQTVLEVIYKER